MGVSTFTQPDFTTQSATVYKTAIDAAVSVLKRIADAFSPHEQAAPDMTVALDPGALIDSTGNLVEVAAQNTVTITAPTTNPRIDRVVVDNATGVVSVVTGTELASPTPPAIPSGKLPVAQVALVVSQTQITNADITDERAGFSGGGGFSSGVRMLFDQDAAPTGWTRDNAIGDRLPKIAGAGDTGGTNGGTWTISGLSVTVATHALSVAELAIHSHGVSDPGHVHGGVQVASGALNIGVQTDPLSLGNTASATTGITIQNAGSGTPHGHSGSTAAQDGTWRPLHRVMIVASKD